MWIPERDEAMDFLKSHLKNENLIRHSIASEAIMKELARRFQQDETLWGLTGLFHDIDLELVGDDMMRHGAAGAALLEEKGFPQEGVRAVRAHNGDNLGIQAITLLEKALIPAETVTGLVVACALVIPTRRLEDVKVKSLRKRMKEPRFAAGVDRGKVQAIEALGVPLDEFFELALQSMSLRAEELGL